MRDLCAGDLNVKAKPAADGGLSLTWTGRSCAQQPEQFIDPYLAEVADVAKAEGHAVWMHFGQLDYFNSATISTIIRFIRAARDRKLHVTITYDGSRRWQSLSFSALAVLADDHIQIINGRRP